MRRPLLFFDGEPGQGTFAFHRGSSASDIEERKHRLIETTRKATKAIGGNVLVVTGFGATQFVLAGSSQVVGGTGMTHGSGFALRAK